MLTELILEFKNWWFGDAVSEEMEEFERIESKHTRVYFDEDIKEEIRVH